MLLFSQFLLVLQHLLSKIKWLIDFFCFHDYFCVSVKSVSLYEVSISHPSKHLKNGCKHKITYWLRIKTVSCDHCHIFVDLFSSDNGNQIFLRISSLSKQNKHNFVFGNFVLGKENFVFTLFPFWTTCYLLSNCVCVCKKEREGGCVSASKPCGGPITCLMSVLDPTCKIRLHPHDPDQVGMN